MDQRNFFYKDYKFNNFISCILLSGDVISEDIRPNKRKYKQVVGWNEH